MDIWKRVKRHIREHLPEEGGCARGGRGAACVLDGVGG